MNPLILRPEAEFVSRCFELYVRKIETKEELVRVVCNLYRQGQWLRQFFVDNIKCEASTLADLHLQNAEMKSHLEQLKALNMVLLQDVEALKVENSQLKQGQQPVSALKTDTYIKTWGYLQDARDELHELLMQLESWSGINKVFVSASIYAIANLIASANLAIPEDPPKDLV